jgi:DNA-binding MarR family transcriptional regulator
MPHAQNGKKAKPPPLRRSGIRGTAPHSRRQATDLACLTERIGYMLKNAHSAVSQDFARTFAEFDIRSTHYSALSVIERNPGLKQTDVGAALKIKRANFVAICDELEERKLIVRRAIATDRRSHALHLTPRGKALLSTMHDANTRHEARLDKCIGANERPRLLRLLARLSELEDREHEAD